MTMSGVERFMTGIRALGYEVERRGDIIVATLDFGPGGVARLQLVATEPPGDFPNAPPHWLHLPKGVTLPGDAGKASELGDEWWKWSRPHPKWRGEAGVRAWLAHVRSLLLPAEER